MLIPVIVIPISIIGTFALMKVFGFTINTLTLFGLVLAIAIVVDDAIVVVENATRYLTPDKLVPPAGTQDVPAFEKQVRREAVIEAMKDIIGPVVGIVIVLLSVFIPTGFIGGITGQLYRQFALTIAFATFLSGVVSILFTPAMCAIFLTPDNKGNKDKKQFFLFRWFNKVYGACEDAYVKVITKLLNFSKIVVLAFLVFLAFTIWLFIKTPTSFLPDEDQGYFIVAAQLPAAASLERTAEIGSKLEEYILTIPGVETVLTINGYSMMGGGAEPNAASLFIVLKPWSERTKKSESAFAITDRINEYCASWQEATVYALVPPPIPGLGVSSGLNFELEDINSYGPFQLQTAVDELVASARDYPEIEILQTQDQASTPLYMLNINRDKLELMGLSISAVFSTISAYMGSSYVNAYVEIDIIFQVLI